MKMFEIGFWHNPTTTKWVDFVKKDDGGHEFVRCRLAVRGFKPRGEGSRDEPACRDSSRGARRHREKSTN